MPRVKKGKHALKRRRKILAYTKGFRHAASKKERAAREAYFHAERHAFRHRRKKKNDFRRLWTVRINAAVRENGLSYSRFINLLNKNKISLNRKVLADLAANEPETFERLVKSLT